LAKVLERPRLERFNTGSIHHFKEFSMSKRQMIDARRFNALSIAIISATAFAVAPAFAQMQAPAKPAASSDAATAAFERADKNTDGKLSKEEAAAMPAIAEKFDTLDKDKDGALSKEEFMEGTKQ
jgi:hypothetical protein